MYKLIIGNVRVTVGDHITRDVAITAAKKALAEANAQGKFLSHIELFMEDKELQIVTSEKPGTKVAKKTIKQSMIDAMTTAILEKLYPSGAFANKDLWFDNDTGQEWWGCEVETMRSTLVEKFNEWKKTL